VVGCGEEGVAEQGQAPSGNNPGKRTRKKTGEREKQMWGGSCVLAFLFPIKRSWKCRGVVGAALTEAASRVC